MKYTLQKTKVIGVDISRDVTSLAIVDTRANFLARHKFNSAELYDINQYVDTLCEEIVNFIETNSSIEEIRSIGISVSNGNFKTGNVENAVNMPWKGIVPLTTLLSDRLGIAVALGNDCHTAALGEAHYGCAHGMKNFIVVTIGHGLGATIFSEGKAHLGSHGFAGEFGHNCIISDGRMCGCGKQGCLEAYCAANGIIQTAKEIMAENDEPSLMRDIKNITPEDIYNCCEKDDKLAIETYQRTGEYFGLGLANIANIIDPEAIIVTGGIAGADHWLLDPTVKAFNKYLFRNLRNNINIYLSTLNNSDRGILGASALAWEVKDYSLFI